MSDRITSVDVRHDFVLIFDVTDGNPNGDPDAGNLPRVDPETMQGIVTDVCLKRKVRDYVSTLHAGKTGYDIYVKHRGLLPSQRQAPYVEFDLENLGKDQPAPQVSKAKGWMCANFFDVRAFGAVMSMNEFNCGQVTGPLQLTFARSIDPVVPQDLSIVRVAIEGDEQERADDEATHGTMGRKALIPYGLYRAHGFFNPTLARDTGFSSGDLGIFWEALPRMWEVDRSAARGFMACRGLYVFSHASALGDAPAHRLFDAITLAKKPDVTAPRSFSDYDVTIDSDALAKYEKVTLTQIEY